MFREVTSSKYKVLNVTQDIIPHETEPIYACVLHENELTKTILQSFLSSTTKNKNVGIAPVYNRKHIPVMLALCAENDVLVIQLAVNSGQPHDDQHLVLKYFFMNSEYKKYTFHMDKLSTIFFVDLGVLICQGVDILWGHKGSRHLHNTKVTAIGGKPLVEHGAVAKLFREEGVGTTDISLVVVQAWTAYRASLVDPVLDIQYIDTTVFGSKNLRFLAKTIREAELLQGLEPTVLKNEIVEHTLTEGNIAVTLARYKTRIMRPGSNQVIKLEVAREGVRTKETGKSPKINGRMVRFDSVKTVNETDKLKVYTYGREDPTHSEAARTKVILEILHNRSSFLTNTLVQDIWFPGRNQTRKPQLFPKPIQLDCNNLKYPLNSSQRAAAEAVLSNEGKTRITLIQGPPGTGKTTVIAAIVLSLIPKVPSIPQVSSSKKRKHERTVWLIAHSNVAVKNIAEKLVDVEFLNFKLLVSKDFHCDWHEHIYHKVQKNIIRSDGFTDDLTAAEAQLAGSMVILCTISMLSSRKIGGYIQLVPPTLLIFDEASQIEVGEYIPLLDRFRSTLQKMVFIGDDKQLPPYGQIDIKDLQSVFEIQHLKEKAIFLDTQYRMPLRIADVISKKVYDRKLKTKHNIIDKSCCRFIDVIRGQEVQKGTSWINEEQATVIIALAKHMQDSGYEFRIITPYDAQRGLLEASLKREPGLAWEDKVFNVDSFQGNEADYIVISVVKTDKIGFLSDLRRVNVMLSRCKKGMIIVTSRHFISNVAQGTLVSSMEKAFGSAVWVNEKAVLQPGFRIF